MSQPTVVSTDLVVSVLIRTEHGRAMWRAAQFEALAEVQHERIAQLEQQHPAPTPAPAPVGEPEPEPDA